MKQEKEFFKDHNQALKEEAKNSAFQEQAQELKRILEQLKPSEHDKNIFIILVSFSYLSVSQKKESLAT